LDSALPADKGRQSLPNPRDSAECHKFPTE
jgi:hypothetical protein